VLGNFGSIMTGVESAINLAGQAFRTFAGFAMEGLEAVASYERLSLALTTLNASQLLQAGAAKDMASAMDVSAVKAEELLGWMQDLAIHSPFTLDGVAQAFRLAMAYGFTADEAQRLTQAFIDFSAGTGASEYNMQLIARAMGQISTAGKLMGQDMLQLTSAGLPVAQILAEAFGVSTEEIIKMREDGLLPAAEVIEALTVYMETNFKGAADNFGSSSAGYSTFCNLSRLSYLNGSRARGWTSCESGAICWGSLHKQQLIKSLLSSRRSKNSKRHLTLEASRLYSTLSLGK
jgi:tape measure domain-containing protein